MNSLKNLNEKIREQTLDCLWEHWSRLGVPGTTSPDPAVNPDPEVLLLFSAEWVEHDLRLLKEIMIWLGNFQDRFYSNRFKKVLNRWKPDEKQIRILGGLFETVSKQFDQKQPWNTLIKHLKELTTKKNDNFLLADANISGNLSKTFQNWGILVPCQLDSVKEKTFSPESRATVIGNNLRLWCRACFGTSTRGELVNFFLADGEGNSNSIARELLLSQTTVNRLLHDLKEANFLRSHKRGRSINYNINDNMSLRKTTEKFVNWFAFFQGIHEAYPIKTGKDLSDYQVKKIISRCKESFQNKFYQSEHNHDLESDLPGTANKLMNCFSEISPAPD